MGSNPDQEEPNNSIAMIDSIVSSEQHLLETTVKADAFKGWFSAGPIQYPVDVAWDPQSRILGGTAAQDPAIASKYDIVS
ncbi:hypothetical protein BGX24_005603 [Mortierella sp. AD032]|nr:hypothetical protein BGX24_005603 [Mortierella sp. AD032]